MKNDIYDLTDEQYAKEKQKLAYLMAKMWDTDQFTDWYFLEDDDHRERLLQEVNDLLEKYDYPKECNASNIDWDLEVSNIYDFGYWSEKAFEKGLIDKDDIKNNYFDFFKLKQPFLLRAGKTYEDVNKNMRFKVSIVQSPEYWEENYMDETELRKLVEGGFDTIIEDAQAEGYADEIVTFDDYKTQLKQEILDSDAFKTTRTFFEDNDEISELLLDKMDVYLGFIYTRNSKIVNPELSLTENTNTVDGWIRIINSVLSFEDRKAIKEKKTLVNAVKVFAEKGQLDLLFEVTGFSDSKFDVIVEKIEELYLQDKQDLELESQVD